MMFGFFKKRGMERQIQTSMELLRALWDSDIHNIWAIPEKSNFLIALNGWLCKKCNYGSDAAQLSPPERVLYITLGFEAEVNNGGFSQYLYNSSGAFANEVTDAFLAIGAEQTAALCKKVLDAFGRPLPVDDRERSDFLDQALTDKVDALLSECDAAFYAYDPQGRENLETLNYQYALAHKAQLIGDGA